MSQINLRTFSTKQLPQPLFNDQPQVMSFYNSICELRYQWQHLVFKLPFLARACMRIRT